MGLFDSIIGGVLGGGSAGGGPLATVLQSVLGQSGGVAGLLAKMEQMGLGDVARSWVGNGPNQPIDPQALRQVVGQPQLDQLSQQTGLDHDQLLQHLSSLLPQAVDHATPGGQVPDATPFDAGGTTLR